MTLRIVMDSAGDMPTGWTEEYEVDIIPINIHFGEKMYLQGVDLSNTAFYRLADETGIIPKTSQPTPQQFIDFYLKIAQPGDTILSIHVTSKLSGTFASAEAAARELSNVFDILPFDSQCGSAGMGFMCREARIMERSRFALNDIVTRLKAIRSRMEIYLTLDSMEYARRSGRVKALQAALASLLNVKPIITLNEGMLELGDKVRTRRRSLEFLLEKLKQRVDERLINISVVHAEDPTSAGWLVDRVSSLFNYKQLITTELSIGVAANLGPGTVGLVAYPIEGG